MALNSISFYGVLITNLQDLINRLNTKSTNRISFIEGAEMAGQRRQDSPFAGSGGGKKRGISDIF